jgi:hypothetical protein
VTNPEWRPADHIGHGSPCEEQPDGSCSAAAPSALRDLIAAAIYERNNPGHRWADAHPDDRLAYGGDADATLAVILPITRLLGDLHRSAHEDMQRVIALYERWVKNGPPLVGTTMSRWWDARLGELHNAILPPTDQTKEQ